MNPECDSQRPHLPPRNGGHLIVEDTYRRTSSSILPSTQGAQTPFLTPPPPPKPKTLRVTRNTHGPDRDPEER